MQNGRVASLKWCHEREDVAYSQNVLERGVSRSGAQASARSRDADRVSPVIV